MKTLGKIKTPGKMKMMKIKRYRARLKMVNVTNTEDSENEKKDM